MVVLAGFLLLAPPLYFLGPFAVLLLVAGPRSPRELIGLGLAAFGIVLWLRGTSTLGLALLNASGLAFALAFGLLSWRLPGPVLVRAGLALVIGSAAIALWCGFQGIAWAEVQRAFTGMLLERYQAVSEVWRDPARQQELKRMLEPWIADAPAHARVLPGFLGLMGLAGMGLAAVWQHRIARHPTAPPPLPFRRFRFNDHLIWGAIFTLAAWLAPLPPEGRALALNLLVVWAGLYGFRGLAVFAAFLARAPVGIRVVAAGLALLLIPVALGTCIAIGLADTWLDIRGRLLPSLPEGVR